MTATLQQRKEKALSLRAEGYNCAQSVVMAFGDMTGLTDDLAARLTSGMGTGMASGEICGAAGAMVIAQGSRQSADPKGKIAAAKASRLLLARFSVENGGRLRCADLKGKCDSRPCDELVLQGVEILHEYFTSIGQ